MFVFSSKTNTNIFELLFIGIISLWARRITFFRKKPLRHSHFYSLGVPVRRCGVLAWAWLLGGRGGGGLFGQGGAWSSGPRVLEVGIVLVGPRGINFQSFMMILFAKLPKLGTNLN